MATIGRFQIGDETFYAKVIEGEIYRARGDVFGSPTFDKQATPLKGVRTLTPVAPSKIIAVGLNYADHAREQNKPLPKEPLIWLQAAAPTTKPSYASSSAGASATWRPPPRRATSSAIPPPWTSATATSRTVKPNTRAPSPLTPSPRWDRMWRRRPTRTT